MKRFFMLSEHDICTVDKFYNANNCLHFHIYEQEKCILSLSEPNKS